METLSVGMYVRTEEGKIFKTDGDLIYLSNDKTILYRLITRVPHDSVSYKVVKASFNIIDLVEENDYIRIITSPKFEYVYSSYGKLVIKDDIDISNYSNEFIVEIITHEQMEQISYKLGE